MSFHVNFIVSVFIDVERRACRGWKNPLPYVFQQKCAKEHPWSHAHSRQGSGHHQNEGGRRLLAGKRQWLSSAPQECAQGLPGVRTGTAPLQRTCTGSRGLCGGLRRKNAPPTRQLSAGAGDVSGRGHRAKKQTVLVSVNCTLSAQTQCDWLLPKALEWPCPRAFLPRHKR